MLGLVKNSTKGMNKHFNFCKKKSLVTKLNLGIKLLILLLSHFDLSMVIQCTYTKEPVDKAGFLLPISPDTSHGLVIVRWIPVRIEHDQSVSADQVETAAAGFGAQHKDKVISVRVVKILNHLSNEDCTS